MSQRGPNWGQLQANMGLKIIEKTLFFLGFFQYFKGRLGSLRERLGGLFGTPWGDLGDALGSLGGALGSLGGALGGFGDALEDPWKNLRRTYQKDPPGSTSPAKPRNREDP